jgi:Swt1-like HEPN
LALSNRDRVGRALEILGGGLGPFVDRHMAAFLPTGRDWLEVMTDRARREGRPVKMGRSDSRLLLRVIGENPRAFREPLSRLELAYAREIGEVANQWAHLEQFSDADAGRVLDTVVRLLRAAGAEAEASQVGEMLAGRYHPAAADNDSRGQEDDSTKLLDSAAGLQVGHRAPAYGGASSAGAGTGGNVAEFRDRDRDYLAWVAAHGSGYVINIGRSGHGSAMLHRASCGTITSRAPFTDSYIKVCSPSPGPLDAWALQRNGAIAQRCGICHPPLGPVPAAEPVTPEAARPAQPIPLARGTTAEYSLPALQKTMAQRTGASKYDPLRDFLTERGAAPITLTFAQIDELVGTLPRSARLYQLWWRNDDPSHHHCRSWNDAGYMAHPDLAAQNVAFRPRPG